MKATLAPSSGILQRVDVLKFTETNRFLLFLFIESERRKTSEIITSDSPQPVARHSELKRAPNILRFFP